jgi:hypothetical protein
MKSFIVILAKHYEGDKLKDYGTRGECRKKYKLVVEKHKERYHLEDLDIGKRIILKLSVRNGMGKYVLDYFSMTFVFHKIFGI